MNGARPTRRTVAWMTATLLAAVIAVTGTIVMPTGSSASADIAPTAVIDDTPRRSASPPPSPSPATTTSAVGTRSARLEDVIGAQPPAPVRLDVDAIDIGAAPIDPVGVERDGSMEIPTDISRIGWYEYGPAPGEDEGTAVLTAHVDNRIQGMGVFYHLDALEPGDAVDVELEDGSRRSFVVDEVRQIAKEALPTDALFRRDGRPRLALITCGGDFDRSSRHYRDNLVVLATPVG